MRYGRLACSDNMLTFGYLTFCCDRQLQPAYTNILILWGIQRRKRLSLAVARQRKPLFALPREGWLVVGALRIDAACSAHASW